MNVLLIENQSSVIVALKMSMIALTPYRRLAEMA
jgi:hypothetical protein